MNVKQYKVGLGLVVLAFLWSCSTQLTPLTLPQTVQSKLEVAYLPAIVDIKLIKKKCNQQHKELTNQFKKEIDSLVVKGSKNFIVTDTIAIANEKLEKEIVKQTQIAVNKRISNKRKKIPIPTVIDSILEANNQRFGLNIVAVGYELTDQKFKQLKTYNTIIKIVYLGLLELNGRKAKMQLLVTVFDAKNNEVIYLNTNLGEETNLELKNILKEVQRLL